MNRNGCPQWLAWDRTEQGGRVRGTLRVDGQEHQIDGYAHRDHSWGMRDCGGATHWKWWNILTDGATAIHAMELQYFGKTTLHGYVQKDGVMATIVGMDSELTFDERFMHTGVTAQIVDDADRVTEITCRRGTDLQWPVSPRLSIHEAALVDFPSMLLQGNGAGTLNAWLMPLPDGAVGVAIGDVVGHGAEAAGASSITRPR